TVVNEAGTIEISRGECCGDVLEVPAGGVKRVRIACGVCGHLNYAAISAQDEVVRGLQMREAHGLIATVVHSLSMLRRLLRLHVLGMHRAVTHLRFIRRQFRERMSPAVLALLCASTYDGCARRDDR